MKKIYLFTILVYFVFVNTQAQDNSKKDKGVFKEYKPGYYQNTILKGIEEFKKKDKKTRQQKYFALDLSGYYLPNSTSQFKMQWHNKTLSQGVTGTCWCFSAISFVESEVKRLTNKEVKLSEMFTVYWEYVERARAFVKERGEVYFAQGSEAVSIIRIMKMYGAVPLSAYSGKLEYQSVHNHSTMFNEMNRYLETVKNTCLWNEEDVLKTIKSILNRYMGEPPSEVIVEGKEMTPKEYVYTFLKINPDDYFSFMSTKSMAYNQKGELIELDNWWHCDDYYNVSLDDYMDIIINAITNGYTISICGDVSEAGYDSWNEVGIIPSFDIPSEYINEDSRQFRLSNKTTTDDHCIHLVGYQHNENDNWFLIKDSGSGGFNGPNKGYRFLHEDYIKLKMMNILLHKDAAKDKLDKIIK